MSRALKFRAWDKENQTWTFVTLGDLVCGACLSSGDKPLSGAPQIWEQYTGLKDCNGKEIYEGDIVEYDWYIVGDKPAYRVNSVVDFDYKGAMVGNDRLWKCTNIEVIGNIHERFWRT